MARKRNPPTDPKLKSYARDNRREAPIPARILWGVLRGKQIGGLRFRREHPIGPYIVDFVCIEVKLIVELDGLTHVGRGEADDTRTRFLESNGYRVIRVMNDDVINDSHAVAEYIARAAGVL